MLFWMPFYFSAVLSAPTLDFIEPGEFTKEPTQSKLKSQILYIQ